MGLINSFKISYLKTLETDNFKVSTMAGNYILSIRLTNEGLNIKKEQLKKLQDSFLIIDIHIQLNNITNTVRNNSTQSILILTLTDK